MRNIEFMHHILELIISGTKITEICEDEWVSEVLEEAKQTRKTEIRLVKEQATILTLAICRLDETGIGQMDTCQEHAGSRADAVCITHGYLEGQ